MNDPQITHGGNAARIGPARLAEIRERVVAEAVDVCNQRRDLLRRAADAIERMHQSYRCTCAMCTGDRALIAELRAEAGHD